MKLDNIQSVARIELSLARKPGFIESSKIALASRDLPYHRYQMNKILNPQKYIVRYVINQLPTYLN